LSPQKGTETYRDDFSAFLCLSVSFCSKISLPQQPLRRHVPADDDRAGQYSLSPVDVRRAVRATVQGQQFSRPAGRVGDPVLAHPGGRVGVALLAPVVAGGAGRGDLDDALLGDHGHTAVQHNDKVGLHQGVEAQFNINRGGENATVPLLLRWR
jgi:hypothetical protein